MNRHQALARLFRALQARQHRRPTNRRQDQRRRRPRLTKAERIRRARGNPNVPCCPNHPKVRTQFAGFIPHPFLPFITVPSWECPVSRKCPKVIRFPSWTR